VESGGYKHSKSKECGLTEKEEFVYAQEVQKGFWEEIE
jgi:hypothetical protein